MLNLQPGLHLKQDESSFSGLKSHIFLFLLPSFIVTQLKGGKAPDAGYGQDRFLPITPVSGVGGVSGGTPSPSEASPFTQKGCWEAGSRGSVWFVHLSQEDQTSSSDSLRLSSFRRPPPTAGWSRPLPSPPTASGDCPSAPPFTSATRSPCPSRCPSPMGPCSRGPRRLRPTSTSAPERRPSAGHLATAPAGW